MRRMPNLNKFLNRIFKMKLQKIDREVHMYREMKF
jgi:hypothetical protein